jgi:hypothetical protein
MTPSVSLGNPISNKGSKNGFKKWSQFSRFLLPFTICALFLTTAIAFPQTEIQAQRQVQPASGVIQPDPAHPVLAIGATAPDFALPGVDGKSHKLSDYAKAKVLAVVFECNSCPVSQGRRFGGDQSQ